MANEPSLEVVESELQKDYAALKTEVSRLSDAINDLVRHQATNAGSRVMSVVGAAKDVVATNASNAQDKLKSAGSDLESSIKQNPLPAVLIALGVGLTLGMISR